MRKSEIPVADTKLESLNVDFKIEAEKRGGFLFGVLARCFKLGKVRWYSCVQDDYHIKIVGAISNTGFGSDPFIIQRETYPCKGKITHFRTSFWFTHDDSGEPDLEIYNLDDGSSNQMTLNNQSKTLIRAAMRYFDK